jgi:hypothetical protein
MFPLLGVYVDVPDGILSSEIKKCVQGGGLNKRKKLFLNIQLQKYIMLVVKIGFEIITASFPFVLSFCLFFCLQLCMCRFI